MIDMQTKILHMSKNHFIRKHGFEKGYRFIVNYHLNNSELYGIPVRALQEYYDVIDSKNLPIDAKNKILAKLELDILEQTMKLIESFAAISIVAMQQNFMNTVLDGKNEIFMSFLLIPYQTRQMFL